MIKKTKDNWVSYRLTCEALKREKILFETKSGKYKDASFNDFVVACEKIIADENTAWKSLAKSVGKNIKPSGEIDYEKLATDADTAWWYNQLR